MKPLLALLLLTLTPTQERGRHIYFHGESVAKRPITAVIGEGGTPFPASIVPCVNCHGEDGRGRIEASVRPADITRETLNRNAKVNERARPPYSRSQLKRAIGMGIDSNRNTLSAAMPRYAMSNEDAEDLLDFLELLGTLSQPGITDDAIRIGVIGDATLTAPDVRLYGRKIELVRDLEDTNIFLRIDASPNPHPSDIPTIAIAKLAASESEQREALRAYAQRMGVDVEELQGVVALRTPPAPVIAGLVTDLLAELGRDVTRATFMEKAEKLILQRRAWLVAP